MAIFINRLKILERSTCQIQKRFVCLLLLMATMVSSCAQTRSLSSSSHTVTEKGAWCWFADPRAVRYQNDTINMTYIGYIDVHGNVKATQYDYVKREVNEVLIRSYFQPDDHNNPTFLPLPDGRIMVFYSRHTDEACFYYRISRKPGDITTLGAEKKLVTDHNTTYPSPFILSDDPDHIYLCWRGIKWHPTIARLTLPDANDDIVFDWQPKQIVQSTAARPYAKYFSNGKDKIYMTYTTGHPDNEAVNNVYFNYIDINGRKLKDVRGKELSDIDQGVHHVRAAPSYVEEYADAVVDSSSFRNWVWQVSQKDNGNPVIAMVSINDRKTVHDYYYAEWTGDRWKKTFLANAGGHFHQTPGLELCYSGGLAIDNDRPNVVYASVPLSGQYGNVHELVKYTIGESGQVTSEQLTHDSPKNNIRPYVIPSGGNTGPQLAWMYGDYYDWIVNKQRPLGYPTGIQSNLDFPEKNIDLKRGIVAEKHFNLGKPTRPNEEPVHVSVKKSNAKGFTISLTPRISHDAYNGTIFTMGDLSYSLDGTTLKPLIALGDHHYSSTNVLGNSDTWKNESRGTGGKWYPVAKFEAFTLSVTYKEGVLRTYINGLLDQSIAVENLQLNDIFIGGFEGAIERYQVYNRALSQNEIQLLATSSLEDTDI
jgi:hypothetical protein